jgi:transmembrane sensor
MNARSTNDEAAAWAVRLDGAQLSAEDQQRLDEWLSASPSHRGALLRAQAVWMSLGKQDVLRASPIAPERAESLASAAEALASARSGRSGMRRSGIRRGLPAMAAVLAGVVVFLLGSRVLELRGDSYETRVGEVRRIALEDGSAITLNSNSAATVRFERNLRSVRLSRGEGLFEVAHNKDRPFVVSSGGVSVRAVGTAFAVRTLTDEVTVTVTEGIVEVTRPQEPQEPPQRVSANHRAEIHPQRGVTVRAEDPAESGRQLSWRDGILSFSGESLAEAVREVNRYSQRQVEVTDPELANKPVIGIFRAGDVDAFARSTAVALGAEARFDGQVIRLVAPAGH